MKNIQLFLDDTNLFRRENLSRRNTPMEQVSCYSDGVMNTVHPSGYVFSQPDGLFRLFYSGTQPGNRQLHYLTAISSDGVHFRPDEKAAARAGVTNPAVPHQFIPDFSPGTEIHSMIEDPEARPDARYKMLVCQNVPNRQTVFNTVHISPDLIHWTELPTVRWHQRGSEPVGSSLYDPGECRFLIFTRPDWGDRRIAMIQTRDWETFSAPRMVMAPDALDKSMAEHYGMYAFNCGQIMLGLLMVYEPADQTSLQYKFKGGPIRCELVYSLDGSFWRRTLRTPFVGEENAMFWPASSRVEDGNFYLYGTASEVEHGNFFPDRLCSSLKIYRTRVHRFLSLAVNSGADYGKLALRQCALHNGSIHWNLNGKNATCAIYEITQSSRKTLRSHEDCIPFTGDSIDWEPQWKEHSTNEDLKNRLLVFELQMESGDVWSISGDFTLLGTTEAFRYEAFQTLPTRSGF